MITISACRFKAGIGIFYLVGISHRQIMGDLPIIGANLVVIGAVFVCWANREPAWSQRLLVINLVDYCGLVIQHHMLHPIKGLFKFGLVK